jgi:hypothetical protein
MFKMIDNFFTEEECDRLCKIVLENEESWYRCPYTNMYILGNSLFRKMKIANNKVEYGTYFDDKPFESEATSLLVSKLEKLYDKVEFIPVFSKPGFQIIKLNKNKVPSVWHYDNMITCFPYQMHFKDYDNFNTYFDEKLIFTTMLSDGEFSFDYYPETVSEFGKDFFESMSIRPVCEDHANLVGDNCPNTNCQLKEFESVYYKKGSVLLQNTRTLHRVGIKDLNGTSNLRVTLQSYGVVKNNVLYLLW